MNSFNGLSPAEAERLAILAEECAEVIQIVGKVLRHGYNSTHPNGGYSNRVLLEDEIGHVISSVDMMKNHGDVNRASIDLSVIMKAESRKKYMHHQ